MTAIYHMTHVRNLEPILELGGLYCDRAMAERQVQAVGIAHKHIKERRAKRQVPTCKRGTLADYVPFYFAPRSPMLYAIHCGQVEGYSEGQRPVLHLMSSAEAVQAAGLPFTFTEGHAEMAFSEFFEDLADLARIDWKIVEATYWRDTDADMDRKRRRQAEFLVHEFFPWALVAKIGVINDAMAQEVNRIVVGQRHNLEVRVERSWYY